MSSRNVVVGLCGSTHLSPVTCHVTSCSQLYDPSIAHLEYDESSDSPTEGLFSQPKKKKNLIN